MRDGHLLKRAGRKLPKGTIWVLVAYVALAAILTLGVGFPLPWGLLGAGGLLALVWVNTHPDDRHQAAGAEEPPRQREPHHEGQDGRERRVGHRHPESAPRELPARTPQKMPG